MKEFTLTFSFAKHYSVCMNSHGENLEQAIEAAVQNAIEDGDWEPSQTLENGAVFVEFAKEGTATSKDREEGLEIPHQWQARPEIDDELARTQPTSYLKRKDLHKVQDKKERTRILNCEELAEKLSIYPESSRVEVYLRNRSLPWDKHPSGTWYRTEGIKQGASQAPGIIITTRQREATGPELDAGELKACLSRWPENAEAWICRERGGEGYLVQGVHEPIPGIVELLVTQPVYEEIPRDAA